MLTCQDGGQLNKSEEISWKHFNCLKCSETSTADHKVCTTKEVYSVKSSQEGVGV